MALPELRRRLGERVGELARVIDMLDTVRPHLATSLYRHRIRCGYPRCRCAEGPGHLRWCLSFSSSKGRHTRTLSAQELRLMVNLAHTNRRQDYWVYAGLRMGSGKMAESPELEPKPVEVDRVEMKLVSGMMLWDACGIPLQVTVLRKYLTDGKMIEWGLATPRRMSDPLESWHLYNLRNGISVRGMCPAFSAAHRPVALTAPLAPRYPCFHIPTVCFAGHVR